LCGKFILYNLIGFGSAREDVLMQSQASPGAAIQAAECVRLLGKRDLDTPISGPPPMGTDWANRRIGRLLCEQP
jgi:hypothetical protein